MEGGHHDIHTEIAFALGHAKKSDGGYVCACPCHDDKHAHLSLTERDGKLLFHCHHGCEKSDLVAEFKRRGWLNGAGPEKEPKRRIVETFPYVDEAGDLLYEVVRYEPKDFRQRRSDGNGGWLKLGETRRVLYRLPELLGDLAAGRTIFIAEGERKVDLLRGWNIHATCNAMGAAIGKEANKWRPEFAASLQGADVVILPDNDDKGRAHVETVAVSRVASGARVRVLELPGLGPKGDVVNWAAAGGTADQLLALVESNARIWEPKERDPRESAEVIDLAIARLAKLKEVDYEKTRKESAKQLGVRASKLDKFVSDARPMDEKPGSGRGLVLETPEAWEYFVSGVALLNEFVAEIRRYVVLTEQDSDAVALWCLHTYAFESFHCTPRLAITSPEKRCGKTTLLDVIKGLSSRALATENITAAAVFRTVEIAKPTLIIDEADTFLGENEELRGILNSGHRSGGQVIRIVGDSYEARAFSTHSPVAIAMIGELPDTLADRSISVSLKRRLPSEPVTSFRLKKTGWAFKALARKAVRWAADNAVRIGACDPALPDDLFNRDADNWEPLFAIAEIAGEDWPVRAKTAAASQMAARAEPSDLKTVLLIDIRAVFADKLIGNDGGIRSADLVDALVAMTDRPWGEVNRGRPITPTWLARRLKGFKIWTKTIHVGGSSFKGYAAKMLEESFARYIPQEKIGPPRTHNNINDLDENNRARKRAESAQADETAQDETAQEPITSAQENKNAQDSSLKSQELRVGPLFSQEGRDNKKDDDEEWSLDDE